MDLAYCDCEACGDVLTNHREIIFYFGFSSIKEIKKIIPNIGKIDPSKSFQRISLRVDGTYLYPLQIFVLFHILDEVPR